MLWTVTKVQYQPITINIIIILTLWRISEEIVLPEKEKETSTGCLVDKWSYEWVNLQWEFKLRKPRVRKIIYILIRFILCEVKFEIKVSSRSLDKSPLTEIVRNNSKKFQSSNICCGKTVHYLNKRINFAKHGD